jgi:hypothetical protein
LLEPGTAAWKAALFAEWRLVLEQFLGAGAQVVIELPPLRSQQAPGCDGVADQAVGVGYDISPSARCVVIQSEDSNIRAATKEFFAGLNGRPGVYLIEVDSLLCPNGYPCPGTVDGVAVRTPGWDQTHFTDQGATWFAPRLLDKVVAALRATGRASTTGSALTPPTAPTNSSATALTSSSIQFSWIDNSDNATGFRIYHWSAAEGSVWKLAGTTAADASIFTDTGLSSNTGYYYYVCAYNSAGQNCASGWVWVVTPAVTTPNNLGATALSSSSIRFSWIDNSNNETGFRIYRWSAADGWARKLAGTTGANTTSFTDTALVPNSGYYYQVCAYNSAGTACAPGNVWRATLP